jgi:serine/threonine-protein kinase
MPVTRPALPSRYATPELIAYGGMGEVYRATDETLGRTVAVKVLSERYARNEEFHARFVREARTAASLSGEANVIVIHDVGESGDDLPFIVMEYVPGGTVADRLRAGRVAPEQSLLWLEQTADALDRAHARGIVHRDVKPANLLVAEDGTIRVSDFGIARAAGDDTLTAAGSVLGSSGYMAPEQARGEPSTPASDRYALACVAFELLTGRRPFERDNPTVEATAHATEAPPSPREVDPSLPAALDAVFARGLAKRPGERYASCAELVADLRDALAPVAATTATIVAPPATPSSPPFTRHTSRPRGAAVLLGVLGLLGAGAALAWLLTGAGEGSSGSTVVLTQTVQGEENTVVVTETVEGETVERTVTADEEGGAQPPPPPPGESGAALNDRGFELLQAGNAEAALPVLESAVAALRGSSSITEAYASYNLATARFALGHCDGVAELLDRSEQVQGERKEIDQLRKQVEKRCEGD